jgi:hypothetical protein
LVLEKIIMRGALPEISDGHLEFDKKVYPRFYDGPEVKKFCVPIIGQYHQRLFPEIAVAPALPLFPGLVFSLLPQRGSQSIPGNTIRKVYLCRARTKQLRSGDILFFYLSKDLRFSASQSITTIGIVEQAVDITSVDELMRVTAKRSVFSADELEGMKPSLDSPVKAIDFLLIGHVDPPVALANLIADGVFTNGPPQSIAELKSYNALRSRIHLGFDF